MSEYYMNIHEGLSRNTEYVNPTNLDWTTLGNSSLTALNEREDHIRKALHLIQSYQFQLIRENRSFRSLLSENLLQ